MREYTISELESGQRFDKYLKKYLAGAGTGFIYKMLRKKNITLNGKKAAGNELLESGDVVKMFLSDETIEKFAGKSSAASALNDSKNAGQNGRKTYVQKSSEAMALIHKDVEDSGLYGKLIYGGYTVDILYEDDHIIFFNKPAGLLSQKANKDDISLVDIFSEYMREYLLDGEAGRGYKPGICNRLDRNTSGVVAAGKSVRGLQALSEAIRDKRVKKFYRCVVTGSVTTGGHLKGYLVKNETDNMVTIVNDNGIKESVEYIETIYKPIGTCRYGTILEVELITGKTHQIRAHMSAIGHPVIGDVKYGAKKDKRLRHHLLHAYELRFGNETGILAGVSNRSIKAPYPDELKRVTDEGYE